MPISRTSPGSWRHSWNMNNYSVRRDFHYWRGSTDGCVVIVMWPIIMDPLWSRQPGTDSPGWPQWPMFVAISMVWHGFVLCPSLYASIYIQYFAKILSGKEKFLFIYFYFIIILPFKLNIYIKLKNIRQVSPRKPIRLIKRTNFKNIWPN